LKGRRIEPLSIVLLYRQTPLILIVAVLLLTAFIDLAKSGLPAAHTARILPIGILLKVSRTLLLGSILWLLLSRLNIGRLFQKH